MAGEVLGDVGVVEDVEVDVGGEEGCECVGQGVGLARGRCGMSEKPYCCCSSLGLMETACVSKIRMNSDCDVWC